MTSWAEYQPVTLTPKIIPLEISGPDWKAQINPDGTLRMPDGMTHAELLFLACALTSPHLAHDFSDSENDWMRNTWNRWMKGLDT